VEQSSSAEIEVPISALEHWSYCPRQCGLIHVEQTFDENLYTIRGRLAHERVDTGEASAEAQGLRVLRAVTLWSDCLGLRGKADVVEMRPEGAYPVEYKVGSRHGSHADLQLCAQALCLEEMLAVAVPRWRPVLRCHPQTPGGGLRPAVAGTDADGDLRGAGDVGGAGAAPAANDRRCPKCSLLDSCLPAVVTARDRLRGLQGSLFRPLELVDPDA